MLEIIGRKRETEKLSAFLNSNKSEFMAVYGRRRIGKTHLINTYFESQDCDFFSATGLADCSFEDQKKAFCAELSKQFLNNIPIETPKTWFDVFELLDKTIESSTKKFVIFLDELPWMVTQKSKLMQTLEYFWNQRWNFAKKVKLIICGSLSSWIIRNIIENTGGLYHRVTYRLAMEPFNLRQTQEFLKKHNKVNLTLNQITKIYTVIGGIPLYLEQITKSKSANQVIDQICFNPDGLLFNEMNKLFKSLFRDSALYMKITRNIAKYRYGISKQALSKKAKLPRGGRFNDRLKELEEAGFIQSFLPYQHKEKGAYYRVTDEYTMFYFYWIEPNLPAIKKLTDSSGYWMLKSKESAYQAWKGYAFEAICYKSISQILKALKLPSTSIPATWRHQSSSHNIMDFGAQIDLLFDRDDDAITICEIKYTEKPFVIDKKYAEILKRKLEIFQKITRSTKQLFLVLISANGIRENKYSRGLLDDIVTLEDLFKPN